jgi:DNA repair exonuclease SbcCD ATPase subunit
MAWAVFGNHSTVKPRDNIRAGSTDAVAEVLVRLGDGKTLQIVRTVQLNGRQTVLYRLDGTELDEDSGDAVLEESFGARLSICAQLSVMLGGGHIATQEALQLDDHLYKAFGITHLRTAADQAAGVAKAAVKQREAIRSAGRELLADRTAKEHGLADAGRAVDEHKASEATLQESFAEAARQRDLAVEWAFYDRANSIRSAAVADVLALAVEELGAPVAEDSLLRDIESATATARSEAHSAAETATSARARSIAARSGLALLDSRSPTCPTCLRPFHGGELSDALAAQQAELREATEQERHWAQRVAEHEQRLTGLEKLRQAAQQLPSLPARPVETPSAEDLNTSYEAALTDVKEFERITGRLEHERDELKKLLAVDDDVRRIEDQQRAAYKYEAVALATARALDGAAKYLTETLVEPLADQIRWQWKMLFGQEGLQLKPDGRLVRVVGDRELPWETLSGGERIWARLVTHLLVLSTSTRLPFAWFDEPLEHLDPTARRAVATALGSATRPAGPTQLIVTTYEHAIARQLAADIPETTIHYVRSSSAPR